MKNNDIVSIENSAFPKSRLDIRWRVTSLCNYQCAFCIQGDREEHARLAKGESRGTRTDICLALRRKLDSLRAFSQVKFSLIGGEVTILGDFADILDTLAASTFPGNISFDITTNLSAPVEAYARLAAIVGKYDRASARRTLHITASFYSAYVSLQDFSGKMRELCSLPVTLSVAYPMLSDDDYRSCLAMRSEFAETSVSIYPLLIREYHTPLSPDVMKEILAMLGPPAIWVTDRSGTVTGFRNIQALGAALTDQSRFCPAGFTCDAGVHSFWINAFGDVYRCPAIGSDMRLGSILSGDLRLLTEPERCTCDHCSCNQFGRIERVEQSISSSKPVKQSCQELCYE